MESGPASAIGRALLRSGVLFLGGGVVFAAVLGLGRLMLPQNPLTAGSGDTADLQRPVLEKIEGVAAIVVVRGDIEGRYEMLELSDSSLEEDGAFSVTFRSGSANRLLMSGQGSAGERISERLDMWLVLDGIDFTDRHETCTAEFFELEATEPNPQGNFWWAGPRGSGTLSCANIEGLRADQQIAVEVAFRFDQRICMFSCR